MTEHWFELKNPAEVESPGLVFYRDRIERNIATMIDIAGGPDRLIPHSKTHKTTEILQLQMNAGITKFKVSTIAEAEMAAIAKAPWVLIAYQMVGPNTERLRALSQKYPDTHFASLLDNADSARELNTVFEGSAVSVFIDVNDGMDRSGVEVIHLQELIDTVEALPYLTLEGLHIYDGHLRNPEFEARKTAANEALNRVFEAVPPKKEWMLITGGTPSSTVHALDGSRYLSPGTFVLWDWGYGDTLPEQPYEWAALLLTRVVSKPTEGIVTVDLGHKAVAAENSVDRRVKFLNLTGYELIGQSEEHGVLKVEHWEEIHVGDVLYGVPYHICPSVALHETATVIEDGNVVDTWPILSRKRKITI